jgi:hypothetical protein
MKKILAGITSTLNWSYPRGSWQYDLLCLLIIATIFLVPSRFFGDRDRAAPRAQPSPVEERRHEIDQAVLQDFLERHQRLDLRSFPPQALGFYLQEQYNQSVTLLRYAEVTGADGRRKFQAVIELSTPLPEPKRQERPGEPRDESRRDPWPERRGRSQQ